jgi:hypothetical protein
LDTVTTRSGASDSGDVDSVNAESVDTDTVDVDAIVTKTADRAVHHADADDNSVTNAATDLDVGALEEPPDPVPDTLKCPIWDCTLS